MGRIHEITSALVQPQDTTYGNRSANVIPLFSCQQYDAAHVDFCYAEKSLLALDVVGGVLLVHQIWWVYVKAYRMSFKDMRLWIFSLCLVSQAYTFVHYGLIYKIYRAKLFFLNELFRFLVLFYICYYYIDKASGLVSNRKFIMRLMRIWAVISVFFVFFNGYVIFLHIQENNADVQSRNLCTSIWFEMNRLFSLSITPIFWYIYWQIRSKIVSIQRETELDKKIYQS
mmetsp:Transcript_35657/g.54556  ORF Transcript_35657/g.54556 Transcript_35657/m.54556 type:complete len:228 (+) Transcript_35657:8-691(+)